MAGYKKMQASIVVPIALALFIFCTAANFKTPAPNFSVSAAAALGKQLFTEKMLSKDSTVSCASCHKPQFAFADTAAFSVGVGGKLTTRNTPSVLNMQNRPYFYWDGRAPTLEAQAIMPIENPNEMNLNITEAAARLAASPMYKKLFAQVFKQLPNKKNIGAAFAAYEKTLETSNSKFDAWSNNTGTLTAQEERGRQLFVGDKAKCFDCHFKEDFTDDAFKNIGLFDTLQFTDAGLYNLTKKPTDKGKFKTPGLRNVAVTAPYMHNGMFSTLAQVVAYYNNPKKFVPNPINLDATLQKPLGLTAQEQKDIVAFLKTLTDKKYIKPKA
jgi:cytochrome c peroxidase